ncbi:MAG: hypothetical protein Fur0025_40810 [Oscillatoriaceae cyanobacterium]
MGADALFFLRKIVKPAAAVSPMTVDGSGTDRVLAVDVPDPDQPSLKAVSGEDGSSSVIE